jgi:hypothetical protein
VEFLVLADVAVPAAIGFALRRWYALAIVFGLWVLFILVGAIGWGLDSDDVPGSDLVVILALIVLLPAEVVAALAVGLGRRLLSPSHSTSGHS